MQARRGPSTFRRCLCRPRPLERPGSHVRLCAFPPSTPLSWDAAHHLQLFLEHSPPFGESFLFLWLGFSLCRFPLPSRSLTEGRLLRKPSAETQELEHRFEPDNLRSPSPGPREGGWLSISLTMRPPRSAPVPGLIVGLRLLRRRPLPLHIPTSSDLSGWRPPGPKGKGCPELRGGKSEAKRS